jgi:hypothetical protein
MRIHPSIKAEQIKITNLENYDDHYSLMKHLEREICKKWRIKKEEFMLMLDEYLLWQRLYKDDEKAPRKKIPFASEGFTHP